MNATAPFNVVTRKSSKWRPLRILPANVRTELCDAAVRLARKAKYRNAGTVEFLYDVDAQKWYFIEVNPRIQVEHTVTEMVTGIDLVRSQILVAQGHKLHEAAAGPASSKKACLFTAQRFSAASPRKTPKRISRPITESLRLTDRRQVLEFVSMAVRRTQAPCWRHTTIRSS